MTNIIERYTWEDAVIEAETLGLLSAGAVNLCLRLARAINWKPGNKRKGMPSGLYWKNEDALKAVNSSRATYYRYRKELFDAGFFIDINSNLIPQIPNLSQVETTDSQSETTLSQSETKDSQLDNPYSEDTYSDNLCREDLYSEDSSAVADATVAPSALSSAFSLDEFDYSYDSSALVSSASNFFAHSVQDSQLSQSETKLTLLERERSAWEAEKNDWGW